MIGSAALVVAWQNAFKKYDINAGQILVTHHDIDDKIEGNRLRNVIHVAFEQGIIPIINENDVLSDIELAKLIYGGDNDGLASKIAIAIGANDLLLLTNVDGLLDEKGKVTANVDSSDYEKALKMTNGKSSSGRGGMRSKIEAAVVAQIAGILSHIGGSANNYRQILSCKSGTHIK
jgi:glutamate 5-kinase